MEDAAEPRCALQAGGAVEAVTGSAAEVDTGVNTG